MKKGDRFIYYGKNETIKGIVSKTFIKTRYDFINGVKVIHEYLVSDEGDTFETVKCLKIESDIGISFLRKILKIIKGTNLKN